MSHINDLPTSVLTQILYHAAGTSSVTLSWWRSKLPLLAVCQAWTKLAQPFVFNHVYVEAFKTHTRSEPSAGASSSDAYIGWRSNAELLISRHCFLLARRLTIEIDYAITPNHLHNIALDILKLDCVDWMHINTLAVVCTSLEPEHYIDSTDIDDSMTTKVVRTMKYFGQNVRNIVELNLTRSNVGVMGRLVCINFASMYGGQLQILRNVSIVPLPSFYFTRSLVVLELTLDSEAARVLPDVCGETLKVLKLSNVPRNFAWHHFRHDIFVRPIVFSQLAALHLSFIEDETKPTEDEVQDKVTSGAFSCDQLHFPVLKELFVQNCTPDCDLLYADTPFPELRHVHLSGSIDSINYCRRLKLGWVGDLDVTIDTRLIGPAANIYDVTSHFFTNICIGRTAALALHGGYTVIEPESVKWVGLTILKLDGVSYETLCKLIARLPNLADFRTSYLEFETVLADGLSVDESLFRSLDPLLAWGERLAAITIGRLHGNCPVSVGAQGILAIVVRLGALRKLALPSSIQPLLVAFIDTNKSRFPHLANLALHFFGLYFV
ncbi:hypothetical protein GGI20_001125 [Coemansia sp. BCRC 34301]|nr:hypothetical protein GGI20_001125 [Coemansia sp. BCRC 34301]